MSLINEALKQAQNQNQPGSGPQGIPVYQPAPKKNLRSDILVILLVCAILILLLGGALFGILYSQSKNKKPVAKTPATGAAPVAATIPATPPRAAQSSLGKAREKATETLQQVAAIHREIEEKPPAAVIPPAPPPPPAPVTPAVAPPSAPPTPSSPSATVPATTGTTPAVPAPTPSATAPVPAPGVAPGSIGKPDTGDGLSPSLTKLKTTLKLTGIIGKPGAFMALLNNRLVRKGDAIEGATITEITADQVRLDLNGEFLEILIKLPGAL